MLSNQHDNFVELLMKSSVEDKVAPGELLVARMLQLLKLCVRERFWLCVYVCVVCMVCVCVCVCGAWV